jgi:O-antigen ligase
LGGIALAFLLFGAQSFLRPRRGILAVLFLLPILKTAGSTGFLARFAIADIFLFLVLMGTVVSIARSRAGEWRSIRIPRQALFALAAFLPLVLISFFFSESVERSLIETMAYFVNVVFAALIVLHIRTRRDLSQAFLIWEKAVVVTLVGGVAGIILLFTGNFDTALTEGPKLASTFKKSGQLSAYLLPSIAVLWYNFVYLSATRSARMLRGILFVTLFVCLVGTGSRTGLALGAAAFFLLFGAQGARNFLRRPALHLGAAAIGAVVLIFAMRAVSSVLPFSFQRAFSIVSGESSLERLSPTRYYQFLGWEIAAAEYPLFGVGAGDFHSRTTSFVPAAWKSHEIHNTYLGVWAETGILGILALILLYVGVMQAGWEGLGHSKDPRLAGVHFALLAALCVLVVYGMSNFGLRMRHLWAIFGLILAAWNVTRLELRELIAEKAA